MAWSEWFEGLARVSTVEAPEFGPCCPNAGTWGHRPAISKLSVLFHLLKRPFFSYLTWSWSISFLALEICLSSLHIFFWCLTPVCNIVTWRIVECIYSEHATFQFIGRVCHRQHWLNFHLRARSVSYYAPKKKSALMALLGCFTIPMEQETE
jgi:hypothetical protein